MRRVLLAVALVLLASPSWAQTVIDHVAVNLAGTQRYAGTIPDGPSTVTVLIERCTTDRPTFWASASTVLDVSTVVSLDNGATWRSWCASSGVGGIYIKSDATEARQSTMKCSLPAGTSRRMEVMVSVSGPALVSQVSLVVE